MCDHRSERPTPASPWVERFIDGAAAGSTMLDVACGSGRHLRLALERGLAAVGVDRDLSRTSDLAGTAQLELVEADLETGKALPFSGRTFGLVVVTNYLWRPILPDIVASVAADGLLLYETFAAGQERHGRPSNPQFLLQPGELLAAVAGSLMPLCYEHVRLDDPKRIVQRICAAGPRHAWLREGLPGA
ncbi:MAG: class I SAM-dependent methyltransferase [Hyphomicrobiaceae bacterium]